MGEALGAHDFWSAGGVDVFQERIDGSRAAGGIGASPSNWTEPLADTAFCLRPHFENRLVARRAAAPFSHCVPRPHHTRGPCIVTLHHSGRCQWCEREDERELVVDFTTAAKALADQ